MLCVVTSLYPSWQIHSHEQTLFNLFRRIGKEVYKAQVAHKSIKMRNYQQTLNYF